VSSLLIDTKREYAPCRVTRSKKVVSQSIQEAGKKKQLSLVYSDHYTLVLKLNNLPKKRMVKSNESQWNLNKPGGWEKYRAMTAEIKEKADKVVEDETLEIEEKMKKVDKLTEQSQV
jgi:hypothetical protein